MSYTRIQNDRDDYNPFGPGTDLLISLTAILLLLFASLPQPEPEKGSVSLKEVEAAQREVISEIVERYAEKYPQSRLLDGRCIEVDLKEPCDLAFDHDLDRQRISFGGQLLFKPDQTQPEPKGEEALLIVASSLLKREAQLARLQIEGHADVTPPVLHRSNFDLAASRAISVLLFFRKVGFDPAQLPISISSYGEFQSVRRIRSGDLRYSWPQLLQDNRTSVDKDMNRRTEILVFYRRDDSVVANKQTDSALRISE